MTSARLALLSLGFSAAAITALMVNAATGDAIYIKKTPEVELSTVQGAIAKAVQCVKLTHADATPANIVSYRVIRYGGSLIIADGKEELSASEDAWFKRRLAGKAGRYDGGKYDNDLERIRLMHPAPACWAEYIALVHNLGGKESHSIAIHRKDGAYFSQATFATTDTITQFRLDDEAGLVVSVVGQVE